MEVVIQLIPHSFFIKAFLLIWHLYLNRTIRLWLTLPALFGCFFVVIVGPLLLHSRSPKRFLSLLSLGVGELLFLLSEAAAVDVVLDPLALRLFRLLRSLHCLFAVFLYPLVSPPDFDIIRKLYLLNLIVESFSITNGLSELLVDPIVSLVVEFGVGVQEQLLHFELMSIKIRAINNRRRRITSSAQQVMRILILQKFGSKFHSNFHLHFSRFRINLRLDLIAVIKERRLLVVDVVGRLHAG